jgi:hypothetical protein
MKLITTLFIISSVLACLQVHSQSATKTPCTTEAAYRQFDFWIGQWEVYGPKGKKAGDSNIELILDSCIILENWTSSSGGYTGKSFNTYNAGSKQWQQTWVDNSGGTTEYLRGTAEKDKVTFWADGVKGADGKAFNRRLTFYKLNQDNVRQHGERSDDGNKTWTTEYDLEYRRKKS